MSVPVVTKYMACLQFDPQTEQCAAVVWVDAPGVVPRFSVEEGATAGTFVAVCLFAAAIIGPVFRKGASLKS
jgi:hypothetical protein